MLAKLPASSSLSGIQARAFSTAFALRFRPALQCLNDKPGVPERSVKISPLVGNYATPEPREVPRPRAPPTTQTSASPQAPRPTTNFVPPPPPPPPSASESSDEAWFNVVPTEKKANYAYSATDPAAPLPIDVLELITEKATAYGQNLSVADPLLQPKPRAAAVTGRTIFIQDRLTPISAPTPMVAIRVLEKMCRDQKVRNKFHSQKFHERKGLKKKRLKSQRWKARFKTGFKAAVSKVMELKRQGW